MSKMGFLICPVRGHDRRETLGVVRELEREGWDIHWPHDDTNQDDPVGYRICSDNLDAIILADMVFFLWDGISKGSLFDLGMAFALRKPIAIVEIPELTDGKSFQNMVTEWALRCGTLKV